MLNTENHGRIGLQFVPGMPDQLVNSNMYHYRSSPDISKDALDTVVTARTPLFPVAHITTSKQP
jgi:hypothetical protein